MIHESLQANVLSAKLIPNADPSLLKSLKVPKGYNSLGLITSDCDDVAYTALDEATKKADVVVVYAQSLYGGSSNASTKLAGEFIGVLAGPNPEQVRSGLDAAAEFISSGANFYTANDEGSIVYYAHCISRSGSYLSKQAKVPEGTPIAYLIAPPTEAIYALDQALKSANVEMKLFYGPPTETNFAGGLLVGDQAACQAACDAFADAVCSVADGPTVY